MTFQRAAGLGEEVQGRARAGGGAAAIAASLVDPSNSARTITVTGNTDAIGSERFNSTLGQSRADQAKAYLVSKGVAESRVVARTQGEKDPIAPNTTTDGRASNRRVLVMLTN